MTKQTSERVCVCVCGWQASLWGRAEPPAEQPPVWQQWQNIHDVTGTFPLESLTVKINGGGISAANVMDWR